MKILIVYDSKYGNTEKIARAIAKGFPRNHKVTVIPVRDAASDDIRGKDLLIVGSPTHGGRWTEDVQDFFELIPDRALEKIKVTAFDTGIRKQDVNLALKLLLTIIGYAAPKMAKELTKKGGKLIVPPEGFFVKGSEGPLLEGELDRAREWARTMS